MPCTSYPGDKRFTLIRDPYNYSLQSITLYFIHLADIPIFFLHPPAVLVNRIFAAFLWVWELDGSIRAQQADGGTPRRHPCASLSTAQASPYQQAERFKWSPVVLRPQSFLVLLYSPPAL